MRYCFVIMSGNENEKPRCKKSKMILLSILFFKAVVLPRLKKNGYWPGELKDIYKDVLHPCIAV